MAKEEQGKQVPRAQKQGTPKPKREYRLVRYLREVRAEVKKVTWPSRRQTLNLTGIVLAVTVGMSIALGLADWLFSQLFGLFVG